MNLLLGCAKSRAKTNKIFLVKEPGSQREFSRPSNTCPNCFQNNINATFYRLLKLCSKAHLCVITVSYELLIILALKQTSGKPT